MRLKLEYPLRILLPFALYSKVIFSQESTSMDSCSEGDCSANSVISINNALQQTVYNLQNVVRDLQLTVYQQTQTISALQEIAGSNNVPTTPSVNTLTTPCTASAVPKIDECASGPCLNGGTCFNGINLYTCICVPGYTGVQCQTEIDECASGPCINGATCYNAINSYTCSCEPNYPEVQCGSDQCPAGFQYLPGACGCYQVLLEPRTWNQSQAICPILNAQSHLAVITSAAQSNAIATYLQNLSAAATAPCNYLQTGPPAYFTSGQRTILNDCSSPFVWKPYPNACIPLTYTDWFPEEPNCGLHPDGTRESCVEYWPDGNYQWNDNDCGLVACPICQIDNYSV